MSIYEIDAVFNLGETLDCGQSFRFEEVDGVWRGAAFGKILELYAKDDKIIFNCDENEFNSVWKNYFDLDTDYNLIRDKLSALSPVLKEAAAYAPGIRILRQEPWEALCSFIISQNNNIPRIKGIIKRLCELLGDDLGGAYSFPSAEKIACLTPEDLAPIRSGFRAKYIISAAKAVTQGLDLTQLYTAPLENARKELMTIKGVGPKVADCVLLYGLHRTECFPLDVWMKRAMSVLLPENKPEDFGTMAGIAQQYIFHYSRMNPHLFDTE